MPLTYQKVNSKKAIKYLESAEFTQLWFKNRKEDKLADKISFFRPVECFAILGNHSNRGLIIIEDWGDFHEPHIFTDDSIRGAKLIDLIRLFLKNRIDLYKLLVGRIEKSRKDVKRLSRWVGFKPFKEDQQYYYVGASCESIRYVQQFKRSAKLVR